MTTFDLNMLDEVYLRQIVKKFDASSGGKFYRSCRGAKELVDCIRPHWSLPEVMLYYHTRYRMYYRTMSKLHKIGSSANIPLEFCRIKYVFVMDTCKADFFKKTVLPELKAMRVGVLELGDKLTVEDIQLLLATKPGGVKCSELQYNKYSEVFKDVQNLHIRMNMWDYRRIWTARKLFEIVRIKKTITLYSREFHKKMIRMFLENWLKGESTGTLEQLTFHMWDSRFTAKHVDRVLNHTDIQNLVESCLKTPEGYILQGKGADRLQVSLDYKINSIHFHF